MLAAMHRTQARYIVAEAPYFAILLHLLHAAQMMEHMQVIHACGGQSHSLKRLLGSKTNNVVGVFWEVYNL